MKRANFTNFFNTRKGLFLIALFLAGWFVSEAQPVPGVCRTFRQRYNNPANRILNSGAVLTSGVAPLPAGSQGIIEIAAGPNTDPPAGPGGAIPANHTIYKVTVAVSLSHPRASELDFMVGYNPPPTTGTASQTPNATTRWVTLSTDNGGNGTASFLTFDDDADVGSSITYPSPSVNNQLVASRDFPNAPFGISRIAPEEPLGQLIGFPATNAAGNGGVFFLSVRDDTPAPAGSTQAFDGSLGSFDVTLITIPTIEFQGPPFGAPGGTAPQGGKYTGTTLGGSTAANNNGGGFLPVLPSMTSINPATQVRARDYFASTTPVDSILNNATVSKTLNVPLGTGRIITDVDVRVALRHTYLGDLAMSLTSPSGTTITLTNRRGGNIDLNPSPTYLAAAPAAQPTTFAVPLDQRSATGHVIYPSLIFSDESDSITVNTASMFGHPIAIPITSQGTLGTFGSLQQGIEPNDNLITDTDYKFTPNYPFASAGANNPRGFFQFTPEEGLGSLVGEAPNGAWTLRITDNTGRDVGVFDRFELAITTIPKPCVLDVAVGGGVGCSPADSLGTVNFTVCSNHLPLDGVFTKVDTLFGALKNPIGVLNLNTVLNTISVGGVPVFTTNPVAGNRDVNTSKNPRIIYTPENFEVVLPNATPTMFPDPAANADRAQVRDVKRLNPFFVGPPAGPFFSNPIAGPVTSSTLPRHGYRLIPRVPAQQAYCRWPARVPSLVAPLDQNPTDSIGLSGSDSTPPTAKCKTNTITISLDTAATPGLAVVNYFDLDAGKDATDDVDGSVDDCTRRGKAQFLSLGRNFGTDCAPAPLPGAPATFRINFDNANTKPNLSVCSDITAGATHEVKINESIAALAGTTKLKSFIIKVRRPTVINAAPLGPIAVGDFKAIVKYQAVNGDIMTRTYQNQAPIVPANTVATANFDIPISMDAAMFNMTPETAILKDVRVETKFTINAGPGKISNLSFDLGTITRDSLRYTSMPRTVTCADIGRPTKIMLVVKDRADNIDSCYVNVNVVDNTKPTITCGTPVTQTLPSVNDCSWFLEQAQVNQLEPVASDACLANTSLTVALAKPYSIAPGYGFMLENTTDKPMIVNSLNFPVIGDRQLLIRAFVLPVISSALDVTTPPASSLYPILPSAALNAVSTVFPAAPAGTNAWIFWGQNIVTPGGAGALTEVEFLPKNFSNLTVKNPIDLTPTGLGNPYGTSGNKDLGTSLIIPPGATWGVYLAAFGVDANGNPIPAANNSSLGIVHSNVATGGITPSAPYPLPPLGALANTRPPLIVRGGWNTTTAGIAGNEFETTPTYPSIPNPAAPPFPPFSPIFEGVVNFPLGYTLVGAAVPTPIAGGSVRQFAGKVNYTFGETKVYTPALAGPQHFVYPAQGPRGTIRYFQKPIVIPTPPSNFAPNAQRSVFTYDGIKQISGIDYQKPYPIGTTVNVFQVTDMAGNTATCSQTVNIIPAAGAIPPQLICNDQVNISLDALCTDELKASEFLANAVNANCLGAFRIEILNGPNVLGVQTGSYAGVPLKTLIGGTYDYKVIDASNTGNFCWGKVKFEDKLAPLISCPENITVDDCSADLATSKELVYSAVYSNTSAFVSNFATTAGTAAAIIPVNAPAGSRIVSVAVETDLRVTNSGIGKLFYDLVTPTGGILQLAAQPGVNAAGIPCNSTGFFKYNFNDNATQASFNPANNYSCFPPNGDYLPLDELNPNLVGIPAEGDWIIQFREITPFSGADGISSLAGGLRLKITMTIPVEKAFVQELCTDNLVPLLGEVTKTNTCVQDAEIVKVVKRTYTAKDNYNNISTCSHTISFKRANFTDQVFPNDIVFDCTYSDLKANPKDSTAIANAINSGASISASYKGPWFDNAGNPHPNVSGKPRPFTCTSYTVNYTDMRIDDICGTGNGSYAVRRTWKVYDACANKAIEHEQYISVQDIVAPKITEGSDLTFSTPVNGCIASVTLPRPTVTDNCNASSDIDITYEVFKEAGFINTVGSQSTTNPNVFSDLPTSPVTVNSGNVTQAWYYVRYTATDKCGNTATSTGRFKVTDLIPPVAVCAPLIKVALTSDGTAVIDAKEFDRGSYDNCGGIAKMQVWRLDDGDCVADDDNKNGSLADDVDFDNDGSPDYPEYEFYKHPQTKMKFCCEDIGDTIMVMFRVWDYSPITGRNTFRPTEPNYEYGAGNRGNINVCMSRVVIDDKLPPVIYTENTTAVCGNEVLGKEWLDAHKPQPQLPTKGVDGLSGNLFYNTEAAQMYSSPDSFITIVKIPVSGLDTIRDLNVALKFHHTNIGNLSATVTSPQGTTVDLFVQPTSENGAPYVSPTINGTPKTNIFRLTFNDEPSINPSYLPAFSSLPGVRDTIVPAQLGLVNGKYTASGQLAAFDGQDPNGEWTITILRLDTTIPDSGAVVKGGAQLQIQSDRKVKNQSYYFDNCDDIILCSTDTVRITNCGDGIIKRAWELSDAGGRTVKTVQTYTSTGRSHYSVLFPKDTVLTCVTGSTDTSYTGKPKVNHLSGCPIVAVAYTDDIITGVANACYRIKRTWKVSNMCQSGMMKGRSNTNTPDVALMQSTLPTRLYVNASDSTNAALYPTFDTDGYVEYVQIISVNDKTAPVITDAPTAINLEPLAKECKVKITIPAIKATDVCSNEFKISWSILNKDTKAVLITVDSAKAFPGSYSFNSSEFGKTFIVRYVVTDRCGNYAVKDYDVTPRDVVKPTPVCYQGLSADILPTTGEVMLNAKQFDAGSYDANDCTAKNNLRFFIERGTPSFGSAVSTSEMVTIGCVGIVPIRLFVVDIAGNTDYCDTYVDVQNNMSATPKDGNCPTVKPTGTRPMITLSTLKQQIIKNADVKAEYDNTFKMLEFKNDVYETLIASNPSSLKITAEKNDNPLNGVSTYDLVLMTKHVLGTQPITDSYVKIAADVNNNGKISTADIVELRKMILAIQTGFTSNKSWKFFNKGTFDESLTIANPTGIQRNDFLGVKVGDINVSANSASPKSTGTFTFDVNEKAFAAGDEVKATFNAAKIGLMEGYQFTLGYDKDALELANIEGNKENFGMVENGNITSSWNGNAETSDNLFTLVFKAKKAGNLSEVLNINSKYTNAEAYTKAGEYHNVALQFNGASNKFALYQNQPNPFMGRTVVGFSLPVADHAKMTIYDMAGRLVKTVEGNFNKGYNEVIIDEILGSGVLNYKLETSTETATKSMIILE